ncbi:MAG: alpha/beta hydrolase [Chitinophagaceae bacterium]
MQEIIHTSKGNISVSIHGTGTPVVLLHGFGEDSRIWEQQVDHLKHKYLLIVPDLPGSGNSPLPSEKLSIDLMADVIKQMLDTLSINSCILLGHSMGGYITLSFAEKHPEQLLAFGLIHSTSFADSEEKKEARKKSIDFIKNHSATEFIKTTIPNLFGVVFKENQPQRINELIRQGESFSAEALIGYYEAMIERPDRTEVLKHSKVPVLFFIGEEDKAVNPADALLQASYPAVCQLELVPHIAHMGMWEASDRLNKGLEDFISFVLHNS